MLLRLDGPGVFKGSALAYAAIAALTSTLNLTLVACSSDTNSGDHSSDAGPSADKAESGAPASGPTNPSKPEQPNVAPPSKPGPNSSVPAASDSGSSVHPTPAPQPEPNTAMGGSGGTGPDPTPQPGPNVDPTPAEASGGGGGMAPSNPTPDPTAAPNGADGGSSPSAPSESGIRVDGRNILIDGKPFQIRGVNWNPVPKGKTHPDGLDYAGFADQDIALMKAAGINAVRTYERLDNPEVLDKLQAAGIYVFSTVLGWWQDDPSVVTDRVNAVKDHPAILGWVLGNEWNYNHLYGNDSLSEDQTRDMINQAAALIKAADQRHLVTTIYGEVPSKDTVNAMPDIDVWGLNVYSGISFGGRFDDWANVSDKPMYFGEYGADAYDARNGGSYAPDAQRDAVAALTGEIIDHLASDGGVTSGGFLFEFADEWWKDNGGSADVQDVGGIAPGGGPYPDSTFNEEWWGIVDIDRNPRSAYDALTDLYNP